ncbi:hypothetical protein Ae706Ps2_6711 [Pseudonocardia sp. Ae706_Ps2]|nr:hypothetical protein Ae706Ps2_6711 [Pseudonocardia sp. Ae706_Ps2]
MSSLVQDASRRWCSRSKPRQNPAQSSSVGTT